MMLERIYDEVLISNWILITIISSISAFQTGIFTRKSFRNSSFYGSYGEITKYGLRPLAGLRLGLWIFEDKIKVALWYQHGYFETKKYFWSFCRAW